MAFVLVIFLKSAVDKDPPPVFISYQWDIQDEVLLIRNQLEGSGYLCWMDVGQMGGGDLLYQQIYDGINNCKVCNNLDAMSGFANGGRQVVRTCTAIS